MKSFNVRQLVVAVLIGITGFLGLQSTAEACPDGQYNACFLGACACVPNGNTVVNSLNPVPDVLHIAGGVVNGNFSSLTQSVGSLVTAAGCPTCKVALDTTVANGGDKAFIETVVGRGWLIFSTTGDPILVVADASTSVAREWKQTHQAANNPFQPPAPSRKQKKYTMSSALCMTKYASTGSVMVGWVSAPVFTDDDSGNKFQMPLIDLIPGDQITASATNDPKDCLPQPPSSGSQYITNAIFKFSNYQEIPEPPTTPQRIHYIMNSQ